MTAKKRQTVSLHIFPFAVSWKQRPVNLLSNSHRTVLPMLSACGRRHWSSQFESPDTMIKRQEYIHLISANSFIFCPDEHRQSIDSFFSGDNQSKDVIYGIILNTVLTYNRWYELLKHDKSALNQRCEK